MFLHSVFILQVSISDTALSIQELYSIEIPDQISALTLPSKNFLVENTLTFFIGTYTAYLHVFTIHLGEKKVKKRQEISLELKAEEGTNIVESLVFYSSLSTSCLVVGIRDGYVLVFGWSVPECGLLATPLYVYQCGIEPARLIPAQRDCIIVLTEKMTLLNINTSNLRITFDTIVSIQPTYLSPIFTVHSGSIPRADAFVLCVPGFLYFVHGKSNASGYVSESFTPSAKEKYTIAIVVQDKYLIAAGVSEENLFLQCFAVSSGKVLSSPLILPHCKSAHLLKTWEYGLDIFVCAVVDDTLGNTSAHVFLIKSVVGMLGLTFLAKYDVESVADLCIYSPHDTAPLLLIACGKKLIVLEWCPVNRNFQCVDVIEYAHAIVALTAFGSNFCVGSARNIHVYCRIIDSATEHNFEILCTGKYVHFIASVFMPSSHLVLVVDVYGNFFSLNVPTVKNITRVRISPGVYFSLRERPLQIYRCKLSVERSKVTNHAHSFVLATVSGSLYTMQSVLSPYAEVLQVLQHSITSLDSTDFPFARTTGRSHREFRSATYPMKAAIDHCFVRLFLDADQLVQTKVRYTLLILITKKMCVCVGGGGGGVIVKKK